MFSNDFVASIKVGRQIAREIDRTVSLPFGQEYSILLKNLGATRAAVSVSIDGTDATGGSRLIIEPNEECDLEGFMQGRAVTNKFKFIEKTEEISEHRGDKAADGLLRVEFQFEKKPEIHNTIHTTHVHNSIYRPGWGWGYWSGPTWRPADTYSAGSIRAVGSNAMNSTLGAMGASSADCSAMPCSYSKPDSVDHDMSEKFCAFSDETVKRAKPMAKSNVLKDGITVKGSSSDQSFRTGYLGVMEEAKHVITLSLKGYYSEKKKPLVEVPVSVTNLPDYNGVPMRLIKVGDRENIASAADIDAVIAEMRSCMEADASKKE